jgi:hypothetical protein
MPTGSDERIGHAPCHSQICAKFLTAEQKQQHVNVCTELCQLASGDETLSRVITSDLAPCDLFVFPKMKLKLKGRWIDTIEKIQAKFQSALTEKDFQEVFQKWSSWWDRCLHAGTTSRVMAGDMSYGEFYDFYSNSPAYFGYHYINPLESLSL